MGNPRISRV